MPDQEPSQPKPAAGAERLSLSVESVRGGTAPSAPAAACFTFGEDDSE